MIDSSDAQSLNLPFDGEMKRAPERRFKETVLFVHHFGGDRRTTIRHRRLVSSLGFDTVAFTLNFNHMNPLKGLPISSDLDFGVRHLWREQIEAMLNAIPGKKIIYAFSMPSESSFEAVARRHGEDITAIICDGGPFLQMLRCTWNLYKSMYKITNPFIRGPLTAMGVLLQGLGLEDRLKEKLSTIPAGLPVLSIRGTDDPIVPEDAIDDFFDKVPQVRLKTLTLDGGHHLDGLKYFYDLYSETVTEFLNLSATKL